LTGLPNRAGFGNLLGEALQRRPPTPTTVVILRPTRTQLLDNLGSQDSDSAIAELAVRISSCLRPDYRLARTAESTFAALVPDGVDVATSFVRDVMLAAEAPVRTPRRRLHLPLAAGIATATDDLAQPVALGPNAPHAPSALLVQQATIAFNTVAATPAGIAVFTPEMLRAHAARVDLAQAVVRTLQENPESSVNAVFEPVVDLASGRLIGLAARADWHDSEHGALTAGHLVALAREAGLTQRVDTVVLRRAIEAFSAWARQWPDLCQHLWVTICAEALAQPAFPDTLQRLLDESGTPRGTLILDPIDSAEIINGQILRQSLPRLREAGVRIAASDAMALADHSIAADPSGMADCFDISPVLVDRCVDDLRARHLVQATVEFATTVDAATSARQVGTVDQHEELRQLGCTFARGPLYGLPAPHDATQELICSAAAGAWLTPVGQEAQRRRSSRAWTELRRVINDLPIAAFACNMDGILILAEGALLDQLGVTDVLDQPLAKLFSEPLEGRMTADPWLEQPVRQALSGAPTVSTVSVRERWLQVHLTPQRNADHIVTGALGVAIDVTHRIQAEQALRVSEARFREVFTQAQVGMVILDSEGQVGQVNPAFARMLGYTPEELTGRLVTDLWHEETPADSLEQYRNLQAGRSAGYLAERAYRHRDGSPVWTRVTVGLLADASLPGTVLGIVEDLRQVKQLEIELRHAQKLRAVGMLAAGIAHEINTPIQFIGDNINFMADAFGQITRVLTATHRFVPASNEPRAQELAEITEAVDLPWLLEEVPEAARQSLDGVARVATIVKAMRNFGHPDQRKPTPIDINAAIRDTSTIARNEHKYVADLHLDLSPIPAVLGYPSEFHQVMLNLIVNAAHAVSELPETPDRAGKDDSTPQRGNIHVRTWADKTMAHISVTDDGCGMTPETKEHIFDPFFTTKTVGQGTGQGLTIVYNVVVEKHHGSIEVESTPGKGTVVTIHLPLSPRPDGATEPSAGQ
ncbi:MAG: PAS domain S-box protein, partial [Micromonosporaceae bacterium]|nr:PAS domain S-box protein [Micromonosporaceae bacterium]